jgi:hypothetical protein
MGGGHQFGIESMRDKKGTIHPIWAGVGCLILVGLTTGGYLLGSLFLEMNSREVWIVLPAEWAWPPQQPFIIIKIIFSLITLLFGSAIISIVYTLVNPPKPGKFDVIDPSIFPPPPRRRR